MNDLGEKEERGHGLIGVGSWYSSVGTGEKCEQT